MRRLLFRIIRFAPTLVKLTFMPPEEVERRIAARLEGAAVSRLVRRQRRRQEVA